MNVFPKRKPTRLKDFDYSRGGAVFITICVENRNKILSEITKNDTNECILTLTESGKIVESAINGIPNKYPCFTVDNYVIMPDHIHFILTKDNLTPSDITTTQVIGWFKYIVTSEINKLNNTPGKKIFQRSFYNHIIEGEKDYMQHWNYIYENPFNWLDEIFFIYATN